MSWLLLAFLSALFYSLSTIFQKKLMNNEDSDPIAFTIIFQFTVTLMLILVFILEGISFPNISHIWPNLLINGVLIALGSLSMFKALKYAEASEYTILSTSSTFINLIVATLFLHETLTLYKIIGTLLIAFSIVLVTNKQKLNLSQLHKGHLYSLLSALGFGAAFSNESYIVGQIGVLQNLIIGFFLPGLIILLIKPRSLRYATKLLTKKSLLKIVIFSILYLLGAITIFAAYTNGGDAGKIYGISNSSVIVTVILAAIFLGEKDKPFRKILATLTAFVGVMLLR